MSAPTHAAVFPPIYVTLRFCQVCGRDDRYKAFGIKGHHVQRDGKDCPGNVETLRYDFQGDVK